MVSNGKDCKPFITHFLSFIFCGLGQSGLKKLVLEQDNREHNMLKSILMSIKLTEDSTQIKVGIC